MHRPSKHGPLKKVSIIIAVLLLNTVSTQNPLRYSVMGQRASHQTTWEHVTSVMSQNMFKYEALVEYFTGDDDDLINRQQNDYAEAFPGKHGSSGESKMANQLINRLQNIFKPLVYINDLSQGHPSSSRMAKYSAESKVRKQTNNKREQKEYQEMEQLDDDLQTIQKQNHKLIRKHGHHDLEKLDEKGIFNYADFMDVETTKKLKNWRRQRKSQDAKIPDLDSNSFKFQAKKGNEAPFISKRRELSHLPGLVDEQDLEPQIVPGQRFDYSGVPGYIDFQVELVPNKTYPTNFHPNIHPDYDIEFITDELNLTKTDQIFDCASYSQKVKITQEIFYCRNKLSPETDTENRKPYRVTRNTYNNLTTYPFFKARIECQDPYEETKQACYCPAGYHGAYCTQGKDLKCKIDVLKPDLKAGCNGVDSDEFVYSIKGYDACHEFDPNGDMEIEYNLTCRGVDEDEKAIFGGHQEGVGYKYSDLISVDNSTLTEFDYVVRNQYTNTTIFGEVDMDFTFDIRDFKYLSHMKRFKKKITDPEIVAGLKTDKLTVSFDDLKLSDVRGDSRYIVGGNIYWETHVFNPSTVSFTTSGFFAQKGYVEPKMSQSGRDIVPILIVTAIILVLVVVCVLYCMHKQKKMQKERNLERMDHRVAQSTPDKNVPLVSNFQNMNKDANLDVQPQASSAERPSNVRAQSSDLLMRPRDQVQNYEGSPRALSGVETPTTHSGKHALLKPQ